MKKTYFFSIFLFVFGASLFGAQPNAQQPIKYFNKLLPQSDAERMQLSTELSREGFGRDSALFLTKPEEVVRVDVFSLIKGRGFKLFYELEEFKICLAFLFDRPTTAAERAFLGTYIKCDACLDLVREVEAKSIGKIVFQLDHVTALRGRSTQELPVCFIFQVCEIMSHIIQLAKSRNRVIFVYFELDPLGDKTVLNSRCKFDRDIWDRLHELNSRIKNELQMFFQEQGTIVSTKKFVE